MTDQSMHRRERIAAVGRRLGELPDPLAIPTAGGAFDVTIRPPGSKSLTNRAVLLAALAQGESTLRGALTEADDAGVMLRAIGQLGASVEVSGQEVRIRGVGGRWAIGAGERVFLNLHNAGTATRFLAAAALLAPMGTSIVIDGDARMRERPIGELVAAMDSLTDPVSCVEYLGREGFPPLVVSPDRAAWVSGMHQVFGRTQSSQFVSAVLLLGAFLPHGVQVSFRTEEVTSRSYVEMTLGLLRQLGVAVSGSIDAPLGVRVGPGPVAGIDGARTLNGFDLRIEPDASGATYFTAAAALIPGARVVIDGLPAEASRSLQGDTGFSAVLGQAGATVDDSNGWTRVSGPERLVGVDADLSDMPDTAMTAAVVACFADGPSVLHGLRTLRVKETDRLVALETELAKIGAKVEIFSETWRGGADEGLRITPVPAERRSETTPVVFQTYKDHRMAMSLSLVGLRREGVLIADPGCVAKTYPGFFADLARVYVASP